MTGLKVTALASLLMLTAASMAWAQNSTTNPGTQGNVNMSNPSAAWAQNPMTNPGTQGKINNPSAASTQNSTMNAGTLRNADTSKSSAWGAGTNITADTAQKLRQSLEQSGFKNIQVLPEAYVIRAQAPDGSHIAMLVSPDQITEVVTGNANAGTPGNSSQPNGAQSNFGSSTMPSQR
jgi:hypothetical protein